MKITTKFLITGLLVCSSVLLLQVISPDIAYAAVTVCSDGDCWYAECSQNADCGTNQFTGTQRCEGDDVYRGYLTFTCNDEGTPNANCSRTITQRYLKSCDPNQACRYGYCIDQEGVGQTNFSVTTAIQPTYIFQSTKGCFDNKAYWFDSLGNRQALIKNCGLTGQICQIGQCIGSATVSTPSASISISTIPTAITAVAQERIGDLVVSLFVKKDSEPLQWEKSVSASNGEIIKFLAIVKNNSSSAINDAYLRVNFVNAIAYAGNLKINEISSEGNFANGRIPLGTIETGDSKAVLFDSVIQYQTGSNTFSITANASINNAIYDTDQVAVQIASGASTAAISETGIWGLIKQWFLWLVLIAVIVVLFVIIFRRVSS